MKYRILTVLLFLCVSFVRCDKAQVFDKNRIQKRSYYHHPGTFNELTYHTPGVLPFAPNPFLFKAHHDIKPFGLGPSHILPAPAPLLPAAPKFVPGDAWVTQHSVTYPKFPVLPPPVVPTAPFVPPIFPAAPALKPLAFTPAVNYVPVSPIPKPVVVPIPRPVIAQPAFVPTAVHPVVVKPIVPVLPPHHHHHVHPVQPTVSSENPENPTSINNPDEQSSSMHEIDETSSSNTDPQSTHTHNNPFVPAGLSPTFVMQIGASSSGFNPTSSSQSPFNTATFTPSSSPSRPPSTFAFGGMVPQVMPIYMQMMPNHQPEQPEENHFNSYGLPAKYGAPPPPPPPPIRPHNHFHSQKLRRKPSYNKRHRKHPHRHPKKLRYTIIKHHHHHD